MVRLRLAPSDDRAAERVEECKAVHQLEIVRDRLSEAEARIDQDARPVDARRLGGGDALFQPEIDFDEHVIVPRVLLHRLGRAQVVHQDDRGAGGRNDLRRARIESQGRHVVHEAGAGLKRGGHYLALARVDGDGGAADGETLDDRTDALDLVLRPDLLQRLGRVNSPPTSRIAAPWLAMRTPASTALDGSSNCPPSEKLSGVTLRMPITCGWSRRMVRSPSCKRLSSGDQPLPGHFRIGRHVVDRLEQSLDRDQLGRDAPRAVPLNRFDRGEPVEAAREPRDLAIMAEGGIDEARRA